MLFSRKGRLKKEFDEQLISQFFDTKQELQVAKEMEEMSDDYDLYIIAKRKIAESKYLFLLKEARLREVKIK
ncbi:YaaL family protein [Planococcus sp. CAU13]|uniref:YaaL family protein n=1 Tax=Planococcus sp. CAU13 TaxID=1541197 RepID=UPI00052FF8B6|nr:YaaL family protein [Planococcus sp. CAU13]